MLLPVDLLVTHHAKLLTVMNWLVLNPLGVCLLESVFWILLHIDLVVLVILDMIMARSTVTELREILWSCGNWLILIPEGNLEEVLTLEWGSEGFSLSVTKIVQVKISDRLFDLISWLPILIILILLHGVKKHKIFLLTIRLAENHNFGWTGWSLRAYGSLYIIWV